MPCPVCDNRSRVFRRISRIQMSDAVAATLALVEPDLASPSIVKATRVPSGDIRSPDWLKLIGPAGADVGSIRPSRETHTSVRSPVTPSPGTNAIDPLCENVHCPTPLAA